MDLPSPSSFCDAERVRVIARCRPLDENETKMKTEIIVSIDSTLRQCSIRKPSDHARKIFTFDGVYGSKCTTEKLYSEIVHPIVDGVLDGYNGTVFAYGQTSCGKTFTMQGYNKPEHQQGIIPRCCKHILSSIQGKGHRENREYLLNVSYLEIYNEEIRDLLVKNNRCNLEIKEHPDKGMYVNGLSSITVDCYEDMAEIIEIGSANRSVGATSMNTDSSRSHSIFIIDLQMNLRLEDEGDCYRNGKLNLVDLAGSERQSKSGATGERFREATKINLSLSALGNVISALVDGKSKHIPYRDSKLTRLLQDSLGGNSKTLMVACISPGLNNYEETLSTLRYAKRAKSIKNRPRINEDPKDSLIRKYLEEIQELKKIIAKEVEIPRHVALEIANLERQRPSGESPKRNVDALTTTTTTFEVEEYQTELIETEIRHGQACSKESSQLERKLQHRVEYESRQTIVERCARELTLMKSRRGIDGGIAPLALQMPISITCQARDQWVKPEVHNELRCRTIGTSTEGLYSPSTSSDSSGDRDWNMHDNLLCRTAGEGSSRSGTPACVVDHTGDTPHGKATFLLDPEGPVSVGLCGICCPRISFFGERFFLHSKTL